MTTLTRSSRAFVAGALASGLLGIAATSLSTATAASVRAAGSCPDANESGYPEMSAVRGAGGDVHFKYAFCSDVPVERVEISAVRRIDGEERLVGVVQSTPLGGATGIVTGAGSFTPDRSAGELWVQARMETRDPAGSVLSLGSFGAAVVEDATGDDPAGGGGGGERGDDRRPCGTGIASLSWVRPERAQRSKLRVKGTRSWAKRNVRVVAVGRVEDRCRAHGRVKVTFRTTGSRPSSASRWVDVEGNGGFRFAVGAMTGSRTVSVSIPTDGSPNPGRSLAFKRVSRLPR